jgi:hypothetical protein
MLRKFFVVSVLFFALIGFSGVAWSSVIGTWDVNGTMTVKVSIKGFGSQTEKTAFLDEFTFNPNNNFEMIDFAGTWSQKKNKFTVFLDANKISDYFEDAISDEVETDVDIEVTKISFSGQEQRNGTIKGSFTMNMKLYVYDEDCECDRKGTLKITGKFTGTRSAQSLTLGEKEPIENIDSILDLTVNEVANALN